MDSFYDAPRRPPVPTKLDRVTKTTIVPEVSMINLETYPPSSLGSKFSKPAMTKTNSYLDGIGSKSYPAQPGTIQQNGFLECNLPRKQVHFKTPPKLDSNNTLTNMGDNGPHSAVNFNLDGKTFKQIYMANIPNRHLDLSILEPKYTTNQNGLYKDNDLQVQKTENTLQRSSRAVTDLIEMNRKEKNYESENARKFCYEPVRSSSDCGCKNNAASSTDKFLFKPKEGTDRFLLPRPKINDYDPDTPLKSIENTHFHYDDSTRKRNYSTNVEVEKWNDTTTADRDPSFRDLFEIVKKQNEQIMLLQEQVSSLKNCITSAAKDKQPIPNNMLDENNQIDQRSSFVKSHNNSPRRGLPKKFSIDLKATSFEVSFRPQQKYRKHQGDFCEPKIEEIIESSASKNVNGRGDEASNELFFNLQESINIHETCPSPAPSIKIDMEDYDSSNDDDEVGMTLYEDIMEQVHNILDKVQIENINGQPASAVNLGSALPNPVRVQTIREAKEATLNYLKSVGVNVPYRNDVFRGTGMSGKKMGYNPSEVSFAVRQLLLKYLPDEHLTKITCKQTQAVEKSNAGPTGSEFSFATIQYMHKYNLLNKGKPRLNKIKRISPNQLDGEMPKILDIATLKLQPKLL